MSKPEFGRKMTCTTCAVRFYDLTRVPAICPKCGMEQPRAKPRMAPVVRAPSARWSGGRVAPTIVREAVVPEPTPIETDPLDEVEEENEDDDEEIEVAADDDDDTPKVKHDD